MKHYFSKDPGGEDKTYFFIARVRGRELLIKSGSGVFSKKRLDTGTRLLIETVKVSPEDTVLDIGCGYGVIGLALAPEVKKVVLSDINKKALKLAKYNAKINGIKNVEIIESNLYENIKEKFDTIVCNPPVKAGKQVVHEIVRGAKEHLKPGGKLYMVIKTKHGGKSLAEFMKEVFGNVEVVERESGYRVLMSRLD